MTQGELLGAAHLAAKAWKSSCSALGFDITAAPQQSRVQRDGINSVTIRSRRWCPDDAMRNRDCHDPKLHALTVLHKLPPASAAAEARIAEADIELNAVHFEWTPERLQAVMVHELGHLLGLDHPCGYRPSGSDSRTGALQPAAECNAYQNQAMHPDPLAAGRRLVLEPSERELAATCSIYPAASATSRAPSGWAWLLIAAVVTAGVGATQWSRIRRRR